MTPEEFDAELRRLVLLLAQVIDTCQRIVDVCDERGAVNGWTVELGQQLEAIARAEQALRP